MIVILNRVFCPPTFNIHPMKGKYVFIVLGMLFIPSLLFSQTAVTLQRGEQAQFFASFGEALTSAQQGDVIYLSGGSFNIGNVVLDKKLSIIGAGHYPSYAEATGLTYLYGNITLLTGADTTLLQGFYLTGDIRLGNSTSNQKVDFVNISRCNVNNIWLSYNSNASSTGGSRMISLSENVIRTTLGGGFAQNVLVSKNLIGQHVYHFNGSVEFRNNIFLMNAPSYDPLLGSVQAASFHNNIFLSQNAIVGGECFGDSYYNNLFVNNFAIPSGSYGSGNIVGKPQEDLFVNQTGYEFSYAHDYHLKPESGGIGAGSDGFDIGLYGSSIPYKEGAIPFTPHITGQSISPETNPQGQVEVNIQVEAQPR